jgi:hypothetical protein
MKKLSHHYLKGKGHDIFSSIPRLPPVTQKRFIPLFYYRVRLCVNDMYVFYS